MQTFDVITFSGGLDYTRHVLFIMCLYLFVHVGVHKFLEKLENEVKVGLSKGKEIGRGRGDIKTEVLVGLHLLLSRGRNPMPSYQPQINNSITSSYLRGEYGIELNAKLEGYTQKYISYLRKRGMI